MRAKGYEIKGETFGEEAVKYISFRPLDKERFVRGSARSLGKEYTKERTGNLRFLQLPERILFRHFLQETDWNVATAIPQNVGKHHIAITLSVE